MFSFGHVIPRENLTAHTVSHGVLGSEFNFVYEIRNSNKLVSLTIVASFVVVFILTFHLDIRPRANHCPLLSGRTIWRCGFLPQL
jgi:hypothetical protein